VVVGDHVAPRLDVRTLGTEAIEAARTLTAALVEMTGDVRGTVARGPSAVPVLVRVGVLAFHLISTEASTPRPRSRFGVRWSSVTT